MKNYLFAYIQLLREDQERIARMTEGLVANPAFHVVKSEKLHISLAENKDKIEWKEEDVPFLDIRRQVKEVMERLEEIPSFLLTVSPFEYETKEGKSFPRMVHALCEVNGSLDLLKNAAAPLGRLFATSHLRVANINMKYCRDLPESISELIPCSDIQIRVSNIYVLYNNRDNLPHTWKIKLSESVAAE